MTEATRANFKQSLKLAWPISLQSLMGTLLSMIDVVMVSHLGNAAVAAVGLGNRIAFVVQVILMGLAWAVGVLAAQYFGAGKLSRIRTTIIVASALSWAAMLPIVIFNAFFSDQVLALGTSDQDVIQLGQTYLGLVMPSLLFVALIMVFENALRSINHVRIPMVFSVIAIALNIVLNFWLINGGLGIDALGVEGAAWATLIARVFHVLLMVAVLYKIKHVLRVRKLDIAAIKRRPEEWLKIVKLGWPMMFSFGVWSVGSLVYQLIYGQIGTEELAVISLLTPVEGMFMSLFFGIASACAIVVGQHLGANRFDQAWNTVRIFAILGPACCLLLGALLLTGEDYIFLIFGQLSVDTRAMASDIFTVMALGSWLKVINMTLAMGALRAGGDNTMVMGIDTVGMWVVSIPLTFVAAFYFQWPMVWVVLTAYSEEVTKAVLFTWRLNSKKWLRNLTGAKAKPVLAEA